jgi:hypothetical protein|tara:strand:- start:377 stop:541 length:165 start_codon:yes stop_codon:yes gene_type:complete
MNDILEFISDLREMQHLYNEGELRNYDFETKISKHLKVVESFEKAHEKEFENVS